MNIRVSNELKLKNLFLFAWWKLVNVIYLPSNNLQLDYNILLPNYELLCWVLALIFHFGCYIKNSLTNQNFVLLLLQISTSKNASGSSNNSFSLLNICVRITFDGSNLNDWIWNIRITLLIPLLGFLCYNQFVHAKFT